MGGCNVIFFLDGLLLAVVSPKNTERTSYGMGAGIAFMVIVQVVLGILISPLVLIINFLESLAVMF